MTYSLIEAICWNRFNCSEQSALIHLIVLDPDGLCSYWIRSHRTLLIMITTFISIIMQHNPSIHWSLHIIHFALACGKILKCSEVFRVQTALWASWNCGSEMSPHLCTGNTALIASLLPFFLLRLSAFLLQFLYNADTLCLACNTHAQDLQQHSINSAST